MGGGGSPNDLIAFLIAMKQTSLQIALKKLQDKLKFLPAVAESTLFVEIDKNKELIASLNRKQLRAGLRADDTEIKPYYRNLIYKGKLRPVDLKNTGAFYDSIQVTVLDDGIEIDATDSKTQELQAKYGKKILGLSVDNKRLLLYRLIPNVNANLIKWLQK